MSIKKHLPILFNADMVKAILSGQKTQTRRLVPDWQQPRKTHCGNEYISVAQRHRRWGFGVFGKTEEECMGKYNPEYRSCCPFGDFGDRLWVREAFALGLCTKSTIAYRATHKPSDLEEGWDEPIKWSPSIHMPRFACRIVLEITSVRVEKLQDISESDAVAEGFDSPAAEGMDWRFKAKHNFKFTWDKIYKNWNENPWVWVIEFKVLTKTGEVMA